MPPKKRKQTSKVVDTSPADEGKDEGDVTKGKRARKESSKNKKDTETKVKSKTKVDNSKDKKDEEFVHWLMKSEPESRIEKGVDVKFGFEDLIAEPDSTACWDGVRNYQARNFLRDKIKVGQQCFFYHSNCKVPGIVGVVKVVKDGYPDHTQFDKKDIHYDPKSTKEDPRWYMVDVKYERWLKHPVPLSWLKEKHLEHKQNNGALAKIALFTQARLSVSPIRQEEWDFIIENSESMS